MSNIKEHKVFDFHRLNSDGNAILVTMSEKYKEPRYLQTRIAEAFKGFCYNNFLDWRIKTDTIIRDGNTVVRIWRIK